MINGRAASQSPILQNQLHQEKVVILDFGAQYGKVRHFASNFIFKLQKRNHEILEKKKKKKSDNMYSAFTTLSFILLL